MVLLHVHFQKKYKMPTKSKIAVFTRTGTPISISEVIIPALEPLEVLVKIEYTTLCRSDLNTFSGKRVEKTPTILGHEIVGRIVSFGEKHSRKDERNNQLNTGDRITWAIYASSPDDLMSKRGIPQKAANLFKYGHEKITENSNLHGGLAGYIILRANTPLVRLDEKVPLQLGAIINCAVSTVAGSIRLGGEMKGKSVLVSGVGNLGIYACAMAKSFGAERVAASDTNPERLNWSLGCGADVSYLADSEAMRDSYTGKTIEEKFDIVLEYSGAHSAMQQTINMLNTGGTAVLVGATHPGRDLCLNAEKLIRNLWILKGLHNYNAEDFITAVSFMEKHHADFPFLEMVYDGFSLEKVNEAFDYALTNNPFRVGINLSHNE